MRDSCARIPDNQNYIPATRRIDFFSARPIGVPGEKSRPPYRNSAFLPISFMSFSWTVEERVPRRKLRLRKARLMTGPSIWSGKEDLFMVLMLIRLSVRLLGQLSIIVLWPRKARK